MAQQVDRGDPRFRHAAYSLYRDLLGTYHGRSTAMVERAPPAKAVLHDRGVAAQIISMVQQQACPGGPVGVPPPPPPPPAATNGGAPPPPPPPPPPVMPGGVLQARRIPTELGPRAPVQRAPGEPPSVIQTAMATKDKKPFTYLPGGIDLSEIKSPRMQKRIMMNARSDGVQGAPTAPAPAPAPAETTTSVAPPPPPPPPPPPAPAPAPAAPAAPAPPQRQPVPLASILTASTRQAQAQAQRPAMPSSPVAPQPPPPPPERAQSHRPQFRNDQGAQMAPPSPVKMAPQSPLAQPFQSPVVSPQPQSPQQQQQQQPLRFATEPQRASPPGQQMRFAGDSQPQRDASPPTNPASERIATNPPWRVTKKPAAPDAADGGATLTGNSGATRGQGELYIRPVAAEAEPVQLRSAPLPWMSSSPTSAEPAPEFAAAAQQIEAARLGRLAQPQSPLSQPQSPLSQPQSPPVQVGSPQPRFVRPQMPQAQAVRPQMVPLQSQLSQEGPTRPRMGFTQQMLQQQMEQDQQQFQQQFQQPQFQQQQPPQRQVSQQGQPKERIISIQMEGSPPRSVPQQQQFQQAQQQQQFQQARPRGPAPARQHSTSSQRVIPVQLVATEDGTPHVSIGGRLIPLTGESVTLPMGLVMADQDRASPSARNDEPTQSKSFRLIQQISDMQGGAPQTATPAPSMGAAAPRPRPVMTSTDPAEDLVPCMRSVQLSDGDKQLMSAFKDKVDGETDTYLHSESDPRYKGAHIPSRTFRILQAATGGADGVSGGGPPSNSSRIGGPGQNRTVVVTMPTGGASGPTVPASQQEAPEPKKYTGGNIPSRSFRVLQQMTADDQES